MGHADSGDAQGGAGVLIRPWDEACRGLLSDQALPGPERRRFRRSRPSPSRASEQVLVAVADDRIVGFTLARPSADRDRGAGDVEVAALYVEPDVRGEGIGGELLDALIEREGRAGFTTATVWLPAEGAHVRRFYEAHRWAPDHTERVHPASGAAEVRYRIAL